MVNKLGLVHVYTGNGKGKTTHAVGIALRALGQGFKVYIIQFMKGGAYTGEFIAAKNFLERIGFEQFGKPCVKEQKQMKLGTNDDGPKYFDYVREDIDCGDCRECFLNDEEQKQYVAEAFEKAKEVINSKEYDLVVLDELNVALNLGFLKVNQVVSLIKNKPSNIELILTGRGAKQEVIDLADYVTYMNKVKHPFDKGLFARRGIEY